jgi:ABC-2 type transport system ATP-binding protein
MSHSAVSVEDLRKAYGSTIAVDGITFQVYQGEIYGLLGPNGAGKTTTFECLEGIRRPDSGRLDILGVEPTRDARGLRNLIGVQLQSSALPPSMTVQEAMRFFCAYHGIASRDDLIDRLGLSDRRKTQYRELSTGLARRLALALAVAHDPRVLFLDEPTAGLDVGSRAELHAIMGELKQGGTTIVLATHDMAEAEKMADRVSILLHGRVVTTGTPRELTSTGLSMTKVSVRTERSILAQNGALFPAVTQHNLQDEYAIYFSNDPSVTVPAILDYIASKDDRLVDLRVERPSLEERFLEITADGGVT